MRCLQMRIDETLHGYIKIYTRYDQHATYAYGVECCTSVSQHDKDHR